MSGKTIQLLAADGGRFDAYLSTAARRTAPGVLVLQEIFGINANIRGVCEAFAHAGFNALAPDLFWRQQAGVELDPAVEVDRERAMAFMKGLDEDLAVADAQAGVEHLRGLGAGHVGAVGYCLGGKLAYRLAMQPGVDAAVSYYGVAIQSLLDQAENLRAPLMLHIAEEDHLCPPDAQRAILDAHRALAEPVAIHTYPGVGHAFARRGSAAYDQGSAETADARTMAFLNRYLG